MILYNIQRRRDWRCLV